MAIPTGSGTEVSKVGHFAGLRNSEQFLLNVVANHIYSILSIIVCETGGASETFDLYIDDDGGGTDYELLSDQAIGANETFVFNEKLITSGTDHICIQAGSSANLDVTISYIDQDFT